MLLVSGAPKAMDHIVSDRLGVLVRPGNGNGHKGRPFGMDNGAFSKFDPKAFERMLGKHAGSTNCLWVATPDVVGDAAATLELFRKWAPRIADLGYDLAFVSQDGIKLDAVPWDSFSCLFIGGSNTHKLGPEARGAIREAKRRGKLVHVGRVNTIRRIKYALDVGADSIDGTKFTRFPNLIAPTLQIIESLERSGRQMFLDDLVSP